MGESNIMVWIIISYFIIISLVTFFLFAEDKRRAKKKKWRIPEKVLFVLAAIGGSVGAIAGMWIFRHKTKHWYFKFGMPIIILLQAVLVGLLIWLPIEFSFI